MPLLIYEFDIDEYNEQEMARHGVTAREVNEVLWRGEFEVRRNKGVHTAEQPYVIVGPSFGGRRLFIPIKPLDQPGVWRPATAFDAS